MRGAGILLHPTSLPGPHGIGTLGPEARQFADWLARGKQQWWQMLPINPVGAGNSPYSGVSAFAGSPLLVSSRDLVDDGLLTAEEVATSLPSTHVDYEAARTLHDRSMTRAFSRWKPDAAFARFTASASWLEEYALFEVLQAVHGGTWTAWPDALRTRDPRALDVVREQHAPALMRVKFEQFLFDRQWRALRAYGAERGIQLIGDVPIFVAHHSADVWANQALFQLDEKGDPTHVAGVPPDYFSATGQRWGNPHYAWDRHAEDGYAWWIERLRVLVERFDIVRLDHFIGFSRYWEIPAAEPTAEHGRFVPGPGAAFFTAIEDTLGALPFIAEDLGEITPDARALCDQFDLPGMRVFQFAFGTDTQASAFKPHAYPPRCVAYTGTHDNDTLVGWLEHAGPRDATQHRAERDAALEYLGGPDGATLARPFHLEALRALYASAADLVIAPLQDVLGLSSEARINVPGAADGNWTWRTEAPHAGAADYLAALVRIYDRGVLRASD